jgi:catechol 2,3-dioxygenase-like lactoylglutathione lyase family enzyme
VTDEPSPGTCHPPRGGEQQHTGRPMTARARTSPNFMTNQIFTTLQCVAVPVADQDRTKALFEEFGFTMTMDTELQPGFRWIELAPPGGGTSIALVMTGNELPTGIDTGIRLLTRDARAAHAALSAKELNVGELLDWESVPLMFSFRDFDGNRFYVVQHS